MSTHARFYILVAHVQHQPWDRYVPDIPALTRVNDMLYGHLALSALLPLMAPLPSLNLSAAAPVLWGIVRTSCS